MSLLTENIIPGNHGKIFGTDASTDEQMEHMKLRLQKIKGVKVAKNQIEIDKSIKSRGRHKVTVKLSSNIIMNTYRRFLIKKFL